MTNGLVRGWFGNRICSLEYENGRAFYLPNFEACPVIAHLCAFCCHPFGHFYIEHGLLFISKINLTSCMGYVEELKLFKTRREALVALEPPRCTCRFITFAAGSRLWQRLEDP